MGERARDFILNHVTLEKAANGFRDAALSVLKK
jgi:hypothetical protein